VKLYLKNKKSDKNSLVIPQPEFHYPRSPHGGTNTELKVNSEMRI
jgi:hypothetical protein